MVPQCSGKGPPRRDLCSILTLSSASSSIGWVLSHVSLSKSLWPYGAAKSRRVYFSHKVQFHCMQHKLDATNEKKITAFIDQINVKEGTTAWKFIFFLFLIFHLDHVHLKTLKLLFWRISISEAIQLQTDHSWVSTGLQEAPELQCQLFLTSFWKPELNPKKNPTDLSVFTAADTRVLLADNLSTLQGRMPGHFLL